MRDGEGGLQRLPAVIGCCCYRFTLKASPGRGQILPAPGRNVATGDKVGEQLARQRLRGFFCIYTFIFPIAVYKCLQFGFNLTDFLHNY